MPESPAQRKAALEAKEKVSQLQQQSKKGEPPSNEQLKYVATQGEEALEQRKGELGNEGLKVVQDTQEILEDTKQFLDEKNKDEKLQEITKTTMETTQEAQKLGKEESNIQLSSEERQLLQQTWKDIQNIVRILAGSSRARRALFKLIDILGDLTSAETQKVAPKNVEEKPTSETKEEVKQNVQQESQKSSEQIKKEIPEEKQKELNDRVYELLREISKNPSLQDFLNCSERLIDFSKKRIYEAQQKQEKMPGLQNKLQELQNEITEFLSRWTSKDNIDRFVQNLRAQIQQAKQDPGLRRLYDNWRNFLRETTSKPENVEQNKEKMKELTRQTRMQFEEKKNAEVVRNTYESWQSILIDIDNDPLRRKMEQDIQKLMQDLVLNEQGNFQLNQEALNQLRSVFVPSVLDQMKYVALPSIEYEGKNQYAIVEDIVVRSTDLVPENIHLHLSSDVDLQSRQVSLKNAQNILDITVKEMNVHVKNCKVHFKRTAFPSLEDNLIANFDMYGKKNGINIKLLIESRLDKETNLYYAHFDTKSVDVSIDSINLKFVEGKHDTLMNFMTTMMYPVLKRNVKNEIQKSIYDNMQWTCENINRVSKQIPKQIQQGTKQFQQAYQERTGEKFQSSQ